MKSIKIISIVILVVVVATMGYMIYTNVKSNKETDGDIEDFPMPNDKDPVNVQP